MLSAKEVRARWLAQLFSTEAADRPRAEAAVRDLYIAAGFEAPRHLVWFDSPLDASWAMGLLVEPHYLAWQTLLAAVRQTEDGRKKLDSTRSNLCKAFGQASWEGVQAGAGLPMGRWLQPAPGKPFKIVQMEIVKARMRLYGDAMALMTKVDESDDLQRAEPALRGAGRGVLNYHSGWREVGLMVALSFFSDYSFSMMAEDEIRAGGEEPPPILKAAWTIARSAGMWWACANAAILTDRPGEIHTNERWVLHRGDGPAAVYRDGMRVYAWDGDAMPEEWILHPEKIPVGGLRECSASFRKYVAARVGAPAPKKKAAKPSAIFKAELPDDPAARLDALRKHAGGRLPLFERYMAGEREQVWKELIALGAAVREDPQAADALAVAYETMRRVEANVRAVAERLGEMGYEFKTRAMEADQWIGRSEQAMGMVDLDRFQNRSGSQHVQKVLEMALRARGMLQEQVAKAKQRPRDHAIRAHVPPAPQARKQLRRLEKMTGPLPLSLRAFYEVVGSVDFIGYHPSLAPSAGRVCPDPLVVWGLEDALDEREALDDEEMTITIAPDDLHKADTSGGEPYAIAVPDPRADAELLNERHNLLFVDYLRLAFRFGGFPGWEGIEGAPGEIGKLSERLLDF